MNTDYLDTSGGFLSGLVQIMSTITALLQMVAAIDQTINMVKRWFENN